MRRVALLVLAAVATLAVPTGAAASPRDVLRDCADNGVIDARHTSRDLQSAARLIPSDLEEYSDCREAIVRAARRDTRDSSGAPSGGGGGSSTGTGPGSTGGGVTPGVGGGFPGGSGATGSPGGSSDSTATGVSPGTTSGAAGATASPGGAGEGAADPAPTPDDLAALDATAARAGAGTPPSVLVGGQALRPGEDGLFTLASQRLPGPVSAALTACALLALAALAYAVRRKLR